MSEKKRAKRPRKETDDGPLPVVPNPAPADEPTVETVPPDPRIAVLAQRLFAVREQKQRRFRRASALVNGMDTEFDAYLRWRAKQPLPAEVTGAVKAKVPPPDFETFLAAKIKQRGGTPLSDEEAFLAMDEWEALEETDAAEDQATETPAAGAATVSLADQYDNARLELDGVLQGDLDLIGCTAVAQALVLLRCLFNQEGFSAEGLGELEENW